MALGVGAPGNGQSHQVHRRRRLAAIWVAAEHDRADLAAADAALAVEGHRKSVAGVLQGWDVGEQGPGVDVDGVAAGRLHHRHPRRIEGVGEVGGGPDPVAQVVLVGHLAEALGDGLEVAPGEAPVSGEALGEDQ